MKGGKSYFYTALSAFLVLRIFAFSYFSGNYTDSDQAVVWQMAADFAKFEFHTPFFYGQLYSSGLEAWLAAPFIWLGLPIHRAVPLTTALMSTLPWIWMAQLTIKKYGNYQNAIFVLLLSFAFPVTWLQTTYISRGFIQSIFLISLATRLINSSILRQNICLILVTWGILQNTNGLLLLPAVAPLWISSFNSNLNNASAKPSSGIWFMQWLRNLGPGIILSIALFLTYRHLSNHNPTWMTHATVQMNFSWHTFLLNIQRYDVLLQHTYSFVPIITSAGLLFFTMYLYKRDHWLDTLSIFTTAMLPIALFGLEKVNDGTENIFFGYGRFFLAIPFAWGFLWSNLALRAKRMSITSLVWWYQVSSKYRLLWFTISTMLITAAYGYQFWQKTSIREFGKTYIPVMVYPMNQMKEDANALAQLCETEKIGAVIVLDHFILECGSMGYAQLAKFPMANGTSIPILRPKYERRHWLLQEIKEQNYIPHRVAIMDVFKDSQWIKSFKLPYKIAQVRGPVYILETGNLSLTKILTNCK